MAAAVPLTAFAQSPDAAYCKKLASLARIYGSNTGPNPEAIAKCDSDTANSVSILETHLTADKIKFPPR